MENYLEQINSLVSKAIQVAKDEGKKEAVAEYEPRIEELKVKVENAYAEGYQKGHGDALANLDVVPISEDDVEQGVEDAIPEYNLTNKAVAAFMAHEYPDDILTNGASVVNDYCLPNMHEDNYEANWQEHPLPVIIGESGSIVKLKMGNKVWEVPSGDIYNLIPGKTYEYEYDGKKGKFKTTGTMRQIHFVEDNHVSNCRDIGDGKTIAYGKIIRSAYIPTTLKPTDENARILRDELGITAEIDMTKTSPDLGWNRHKLSVYSYAYILTQTVNLKSLITTVMNEVCAGGTILIHCYAGADRTGTICALIEALLGATPSYICHDFEGTSFIDWCNFKRIDDERFDEYPKGELRSLFKALKATYGKKGETLQQQTYNYFTKKLGISATLISKFRTAMAEGL